MNPTRTRAVVAIAFTVMVQSGCDHGPRIGPPDKITRTGDGQAATVGTAVPVAPAVVIVDANDRGVPGIAVTFAISGGGGSIASISAQTDQTGTATAGSWTLGTAIGPNTLTATASEVPGSPVTFTASATAGPTTTLIKLISDLPLRPPAGGNIDSIVVIAADRFLNPVANQIVNFTVTAGGGTVSPSSRVTLADGRAAARWTIGPAINAENTIVASLPDGSLPVTFTMTSAPAVGSVRLGAPVLVVDSGSNVSTTVSILDPAGASIAAALDIRTRNASIASGLAMSPGISVRGNGTGQVFLIATSLDNPLAQDSSLVIVGNVDAPVVRMTVPRFDLKADTVFTVSLIVDIRSATTSIGAATLNVVWDPAVLALQGEEASAVPVTINTASAASGFISVAFASSTGLSGAIELRRLTFRTTATAGRRGSLTANVVDMAAAGTFTNLVSRTVSGVFPVRVR